MKCKSYSLDDLLQAGEKAFNSKKNLGAIRLFTKALCLDPKSITAHFYLGLVKLKKGLLNESEKHFKKVLAQNPAEGNAHLNLGVIKHKQHNDHSAIRHYKMELLNRPECLEAHYNLGLIYLTSEKWKLAAQHLEQCWRKNHYAEDLVKDFAMAVQKAGLTGLEKNIYIKEIRKNPHNIWSLNNLGACFNEEGKYLEALKVLKKAAVIAPLDRTIRRNLKYSLEQIGHGSSRPPVLKDVNRTHTPTNGIGCANPFEK